MTDFNSTRTAANNIQKNTIYISDLKWNKYLCTAFETDLKHFHYINQAALGENVFHKNVTSVLKILNIKLQLQHNLFKLTDEIK